MQTHRNLTASYLWQPGEFARRLIGERPSPVPPTRDLWPPSQPLSVSTLHVAYLQDESIPRRAATLPLHTYTSTTEQTHSLTDSRAESSFKPRLCTVGTNTEPPLTIFTRLKHLVKRDEESAVHTPPGRLTAVPRETTFDLKEDENAARRAFNEIKKVMSGAKYRIAPNTEAVDSPKIVYDVPKPGDRMVTTFGAHEQRNWYKLPSRAEVARRLRAIGGWCRQRPRRPPRRQPHPPRLQITQV